MSGRSIPRRALVVFSGRADLWWLRLLRPGFRHCFVVLEAGDRWICLNPLAHRTAVDTWTIPADLCLRTWLEGQAGLRVAEVEVAEPARGPCRLRLLSCVEQVKRIVGLDAPWVLTPAQLWRHLTRKGKNSLHSEKDKHMFSKSTPELCPDQTSSPLGCGASGVVWNKTGPQRRSVMGGFFASDPPAPPPAPVLPPAPAPADEAAKERLDSISRNRRGMAGTIVTSERGVLEPAASGAAKSLLGD